MVVGGCFGRDSWLWKGQYCAYECLGMCTVTPNQSPVTFKSIAEINNLLRNTVIGSWSGQDSIVRVNAEACTL